MTNTRIALAAFVALALLAVPASGKDKKPKKEMADTFTGTFVTTNAPTSAGLGQPVTIWVEAYTSDEVAGSLAQTLVDKGQFALRDALGNLRAGTIRIGTSRGYPLAVARQRPAPDGRLVVLVTARPLDGFVPDQGTRSEDYPISFIELRLKADGTGEGTIVGMAKLSVDEQRNLHVASFATQPSRLFNVQTDRKSAN